MIELIHGDCLEEMKKIPDGSVDLVLTDPPYGTTQNKWDTIIDLKQMWTELHRITKDNGAIVLTSQQPFSSILVTSNIKNFKYTWTWVKEAGTGFLNAKKYPLKDNEDVLVFCKKPHVYNPQMREGKPYTIKQGNTKSSNYGTQTGAVTVSNGDRYPLTTIRFSRDKDKQHPTQKPVALMEYLIKTYTNEGETVLDFTMGSGTTGVACRNLNRNFIGIELDETYYNIAKERIKT
jgi:DNA modification methylase